LGELTEFASRSELSRDLFAIKRDPQQTSLEREVLPNGTKARQESLSEFALAKPTHAPLAFTCRLATVLGPIVHASGGFDEHMSDVCQFGDVGLRGRVAAQLISDDLARQRAGAKRTLEEPLGCCLVAPLL
jgi:hypothetical protein